MEFDVGKPIEEVFDFATACDAFSRFLFPLGPVAGVASSKMVDAPQPRTGAKRDVFLTDGSTVHEELLVFERPSRHRYRWLNRPPPPFSWLIKGAEGDWTFTPTQTGTRIVWVYHFDLTSPPAFLPTLPFLALFRRYMQKGLERLPAAMAGSQTAPKDMPPNRP